MLISDYPDYCPVCHVSGFQPCIDSQGREVTDHADRPNTYVNEAGVSDE